MSTYLLRGPGGGMGENMIKLRAGENKLAQVRSREWLTWLELSGGGAVVSGGTS